MENAKPGDTRLKIDSTLFTNEKSKSRLKRALPDNYYSRLSLGLAKLRALFDAVKPINNAEKA
ncbi:MAG: hypothetical protein LBU79_02670 [Planctomycetota bacterium]|jgi:type I restriction enzyme M protein|nr:hypothetical protein [Planctomycetota bacterium]